MPLSVHAGISIAFIFTTILTAYGCYSLANTPKAKIKLLLLVSSWLALQAILSLSGIYAENLDFLPPRILLFGIAPTIVFIVWVFITQKSILDDLSLETLTYIHTVRVPVELVLYGLYLYQAIPERMTFEGKNFDIIAGITAPFVAYFGIKQQRLNKATLIAWNIICIGLLLNIVINALLSAPTPLQQFAFDQPNIGILVFPFSWLPTFVVPVVLFCHLAVLRKLFS